MTVELKESCSDSSASDSSEEMEAEWEEREDRVRDLFLDEVEESKEEVNDLKVSRMHQFMNEF